MPEPLDLFLHEQFLALEFHDFQIIDRRMGQAFCDFFFECLMPFFEFGKVRLQRHAECLLNQWLPDEVSVAQTGRKGDHMPGFASQQMVRSP